MKRVFVGTIAVMLLLSMGLTGSIAAGSEAEQGKRFVDSDENGVCDLSGTFCHYTDADQDGVCDYRGTKQRECRRSFTDEGGDARGNCHNRGIGLGHGFRDGQR